MAQAGPTSTTSPVPTAAVIAFPRAPLTARERVVIAVQLNERASELDQDLLEMEDLAQHAATVLSHLNAVIAKFQNRLGR